MDDKDVTTVEFQADELWRQMRVIGLDDFTDADVAAIAASEAPIVGIYSTTGAAANSGASKAVFGSDRSRK